MASITKRTRSDGSIVYRAQVRLKGQEPQSLTFERRTDAVKWIQKTETELRENRFFGTKEGKRKTVSEAIERYIEDPNIVSQKNYENKKAILRWWGNEIGHRFIADISPALITEKRDRLAKAKKKINKRLQAKTKEIIEPETFSKARVNRYLATISHLFTIALKEWGWIEFNPVKNVSKLKEPRGRVRYLTADEKVRLLKACTESASPYLSLIVRIALSTGMRKGEILGLTWQDVDLITGRLLIRESKNGEQRSIRIMPDVHSLLLEHSKLRNINSNFVFPSQDQHKPASIKTAWENALKSAKIEDFRFHDLRHTTASYLLMSGSSIAEIAEVLGHKTLAMVKRYSHMSEGHADNALMRMHERFLS